MKRERFYNFILGKIDSMDYFQSTDEEREFEKKKLLSVMYSRINIKGSSKSVSVFRCPAENVHKTLKRLVEDAFEWKFGRNFGSLEGYTWKDEKGSLCFPRKQIDY
ncbi:MAG: hypothetical protein V1660_00260 [archaeon]